MKTISVQDLKAKQDRNDTFQLIDVREGYEVEICAISGSIHIPMGEVPTRLDQINKGGDVVVHCRSGKRSAAVVNHLMENGYEQVYNLTGGILAWAEEVDTTMEKY